jgi:molecular chaperone IbpA
MTHFDFSPLFRSTIGFDRWADLFDTAMAAPDAGGYPPYNIEATDENAYRITMAVAGFGDDEISVVQQPNELVIAGTRKEPENTRYLYRGIAGRAFERRFQIADHVKVSGARLENGLLRVELVRELPEALRPRKIAITTGTPQRRLDAKAA